MDYEVTPEELKSLLDRNSDVVVLDVREPWEIATASLRHNKHIPMNEIPARHRELDADTAHSRGLPPRCPLDAGDDVAAPAGI